MESLRKLLMSEVFLATMPSTIMLYYYVKREKEVDDLLSDLARQRSGKTSLGSKDDQVKAEH